MIGFSVKLEVGKYPNTSAKEYVDLYQAPA